MVIKEPMYKAGSSGTCDIQVAVLFDSILDESISCEVSSIWEPRGQYVPLVQPEHPESELGS